MSGRRRRRRRSEARDAGFTLVELIVVIGIMSILLAIAVPSFLGLQRSVQDAATQADLGNDRTALIGWGIDNNGTVPSATGFNPAANGLNLVGYGWSNSGQSTGYSYATDPGVSAWCLQMTSASGTTWLVSENQSIQQGTCRELGATNY